MIPTLNSATAGGGSSLEQFVALAARHGFSGVDISIEPAHQLGLPTAAALFESQGIFPATFDLPVEWRRDEATFRAGLETLPGLAKFAQDLDCVRCVTYVLPESDAPRDRYAKISTARFIEIGRILADNGVRLGLEFIGPHHFRTRPENVWFYDIAGALDVADEINSHLQSTIVGLLVDSFHWHTAQNSTMDLASIPLEQIVHVHLNDAPLNTAIPDLQDGARELPGATGAIDVTGFLSTLAALGYDGPVAVETFSDALRKMTPDQAAAKAGAAMTSVFQSAGVKPLRLL